MIDMNKKYRTRDGYPVRVLCVDRQHKSHTVAVFVRRDNEDVFVSLTPEGRYFIGSEFASGYDLIEVPPFEDFKIDEPVMVRNYPDEQWKRRYFAGVSKDGYPLTWPSGMTSWSSSKYDGNNLWQECRRPTPEELGADQK